MRVKKVWFLLLVLSVVLSAGLREARAQSGGDGDILWDEPVNLSNTPMATSQDVFVLSDPAGLVHLFWSEKEGVAPGNSPDTILYSQWNGTSWSRAVDLFFAPFSDGNLVVLFPHAILDDQGIIHLIWISQPNFPYYTLYYSSALAGQAQYVQAWRPKVALAEDLTGTNYSLHLTYEAPDTIHVLYASGIATDRALEDPGVKHLKSVDGGDTWTTPTTVFNVPSAAFGASHVRATYIDPGMLFASWTLWNETGNGQMVYFSRSLDSGATWNEPQVLAQRREGEYERDWNSLIKLPDGPLMAMWEGGYRAYRHAMFSEDNGATWTEPWDLFPNLIGENGFAEFARDSLGRVHLFYSQRIREGTETSQTGEEREAGLWHSVWRGGMQWSDPKLSGGIIPMVNPKVAIVNGNRVVAAWYSNTDYEIMVMTGQIEDAPEVPAVPWSQEGQILRSTPEAAPAEATAPAVLPGAQPAATQPSKIDTTLRSSAWLDNPAIIVFVGALPALLILPLFLVLWKRKKV